MAQKQKNLITAASVRGDGGSISDAADFVKVRTRSWAYTAPPPPFAATGSVEIHYLCKLIVIKLCSTMRLCYMPNNESVRSDRGPQKREGKLLETLRFTIFTAFLLRRDEALRC